MTAIVAYLEQWVFAHPCSMALISGLSALIGFWVCASILLRRLKAYEGARPSGLDTKIARRLVRMVTEHSLWPAAFIGVGVYLALWWIHIPKEPNPTVAFSESLKVAATIVAAGYFAYQILAGALFSTTSVAIQAIRDPNDPSLILATATLTRGDNWLAVIVVNSYKVDDGPTKDTWIDMEFPRRGDDSLRLGPKEQTSTTFFIRQAPRHEVTIIARVESYSILWPVASESYAKTTVLASAPVPIIPPARGLAALLGSAVQLFTRS